MTEDISDIDTSAAAAQTLRERGVVCIGPLPGDLPSLQREFRDTCAAFPELKDTAPPYVLGGFAAMGNPASFHNPLVRKLRQWCMVAVIPVLRHLADGRKLEQAVDRMMFRPSGKQPTPESWHRDEAPQAGPDDITFGGWINLDSTPQYFSCAPGTHCKTGAGSGGGFAKQSEAQVKAVLRTHPAEKIAVPPGCIMLFYETILHEVIGSKRRGDSLRLFLGWRLTHDKKPLYPSNITIMRDFGVPRLKSGQWPPMYGKLHWNLHLKLVKQFSARMVDACLHDRFRPADGETYKVVMQMLPSLNDMRIRIPYPRYTADELDVFTPRKHWNLLVPGKTRVYKQIRF